MFGPDLGEAAPRAFRTAFRKVFPVAARRVLHAGARVAWGVWQGPHPARARAPHEPDRTEQKGANMAQARLMDRAEDYERFGVRPGPVEPWEDGRRIEDGERG